jgi:hypothetical protein
MVFKTSYTIEGLENKVYAANKTKDSIQSNISLNNLSKS